MLTHAEARRTADEWIAAWNDHDLHAILGHYADDVEFSSPLVVRRMGFLRGKLRGRKSLGEYFAQGLAANPALHFELLTVAVGMDGVCMVYHRDSGATVCEVLAIGGDGLIHSASAYYDDDL